MKLVIKPRPGELQIKSHELRPGQLFKCSPSSENVWLCTEVLETSVRGVYMGNDPCRSRVQQTIMGLSAQLFVVVFPDAVLHLHG
jgi:hypothetical protein